MFPFFQALRVLGSFRLKIEEVRGKIIALRNGALYVLLPVLLIIGPLLFANLLLGGHLAGMTTKVLSLLLFVVELLQLVMLSESQIVQPSCPVKRGEYPLS